MSKWSTLFFNVRYKHDSNRTPVKVSSIKSNAWIWEDKNIMIKTVTVSQWSEWGHVVRMGTLCSGADLFSLQAGHCNVWEHDLEQRLHWNVPEFTEKQHSAFICIGEHEHLSLKKKIFFKVTYLYLFIWREETPAQKRFMSVSCSKKYMNSDISLIWRPLRPLTANLWRSQQWLLREAVRPCMILKPCCFCGQWPFFIYHVPLMPFSTPSL